MTRKPETEAVLEAKAELGKIVEDLRALKGRVLALSRRLRRAAGAAPTVATFADGSRQTAEGWMAGSLEEAVREELGNAIGALAADLKLDWRPEIRRVVRNEHAHRATQEQVPAPTGPQTVAEANRAAIVAAMQREGVQVQQAAGQTFATIKLTL